MRVLNKVTQSVNSVLLWIAGGFLLAMILLTCSNIFLRIVWLPVKGTTELIGFFGSTAVAFALGYTQLKQGHISVDIVIKGFSKRTRTVIYIFNYTICTLFFALISWETAKWSTTLWETGELTETLGIRYYPFTYGLAFGCAILSLVFFIDLLKTIFPGKADKK